MRKEPVWLYCLVLSLLSCSLPLLSFAQQAKSVTIKGIKYTGLLEDNNFFLLTGRGDTALKIAGEDYIDFRFDDFNKDGYKDILLGWGGNTPDVFSLYLYVPVAKRFKEVHHFDDFPAPLPVAGTPYFYSYHKAGCADLVWVSDLFYIKNNRAIKLGAIFGNGCDAKESVKQGISVYTYKKGRKSLLQSLPIDIIGRYNDYKWGFIKQYWAKNYQRFIP